MSSTLTPRERAFIKAYAIAGADNAMLCKLMRCKRSTIAKLKTSIRAKLDRDDAR